jgi:hypothetical protein
MNINNYLLLENDRLTLYKYLLSSTPENISRYNNLLKDIKHRYSAVLNLKNKFKENFYKLQTLYSKKLLSDMKQKINDNIDTNSKLKNLFSGGAPLLDEEYDDKKKYEHAKNIMDKTIENYNEEIFEDNKKLKEIVDKLKLDGNKEDKTIKELEEHKYKLKYNEDFYNSEITTQDVIIFVFVIFIIRTITLILLRLAIDVNMLQTFEHGLLFYIGLYILFIGILFSLVNMKHDLNNNFTLLKEYLYYLYSDINGIYRIIIHISILFIILLIPVIIKAEEDKAEDKYEENDLKRKREIYKELSSFSLILWVFQAIIALIIK